MLKFQRALLLEALLLFQGVLTVVTAVVFAGVTLRFFYQGEGVGLDLMLELIPSLMPVALSYSIPFSWLAAIALTLGRMSADREIIALRSAGLHLRVVIVPLATAGLLIALATTALNAYTVPDAQRSLRAGVRRYVGVFLTSLKSVDRTVTLENGRFSFGRYARGAFHEVELDRRRDDGELELKVLARQVRIRPPSEGGEAQTLEFEIEDAYVLSPAETGEPTVDYRGGTSRIHMGRVTKLGASVMFNEFFGTQRFVERPKDMNMSDLLYAEARGGVWRGPLPRVLVSRSARLADGLAPFVMGLFATGMALLVPAASRRIRHFLLCFLPPVLLYAPLSVAGPNLGRQGAIPPDLVMWLGDIVLGVAALVLLVLASRR